MSITRFQKVALGMAGGTALIIGGFILMAPHVFYASYGIALEADPNLLSELRAPAANLMALSAVMLIGVFRSAWAQFSATLALTVFVAFPAGRIVSLLVDGLPSSSVLGALAIEVAIGAICVAAFRPGRRGRASMLVC
jgi:hypothetical protein